MVKCSECKYLEERTEVKTVLIEPKEPGPGPLPLPGPVPGPGPVSPQAMGTIRRAWFTCSKVNETISRKYGFQKEYEIVKVNDERICPDFKKK
jgi:hypothetical protein